MLVLCRKKEWTALRVKMAESMNKLTSSLTRFYKDRIHMPSPEKEVAFTWSSYKKSQQLCYSIAMELLISINRGAVSGRKPAAFTGGARTAEECFGKYHSQDT